MREAGCPSEAAKGSGGALGLSTLQDGPGVQHIGIELGLQKPNMGQDTSFSGAQSPHRQTSGEVGTFTGP